MWENKEKYCAKRLVIPQADARSSIREAVKLSPDTMASIHEWVLLYRVVKAWDVIQTSLSATNTNFRAIIRATKAASKSTRLNGKYGIEFAITKTIPKFNKGAEKCDLTWSDSFVGFKNVLQGHHRMAWKQVLHEHFPEPVDAMMPVLVAQDCNLEENFHQALQLFIQQTLNKKKPRDRQYIYMQPGGDYVVQRPMMQAPINNLWRFEEMIRMAEALPAGDMQPPNKVLQPKWFYMSFHSDDHTKYVESRWRLCNETLESVAEYFENIFNSQVVMAPLQINASVRSSIMQNMSFVSRLRSVTRRKSVISQNSITQTMSMVADITRHIINKTTSGRVTTTAIAAPTTTNVRRSRRTRFLPIAVTRHSNSAPHTDQRVITPLKSAIRTQKIKTRIKSTTKYASASRTTMMCTTQVTTMSCTLVWIRQSQVRTRHQSWVKAKSRRMRVIIFTLIKNWRQDAISLASPTIISMGAVQVESKGWKRETSPTSMDNNLHFTDTVLMGLDSIDADLKGPDDITDPFSFNKWWTAPVEPFSIKNTNNLENVLYEMKNDIGL
jgi:hypothetical protein